MSEPKAQQARRDLLAVLARAERAELEAAIDGWPDLPEHHLLRGPETGLLMARGRAGGGGAPFNLGEVTMSRAVVRLASGEVGYGQCLGRDGRKALLVALFDALWQTPAHHALVEERVAAPIRARLDAAARRKERQVAATRVNFFTLVRGED